MNYKVHKKIEGRLSPPKSFRLLRTYDTHKDLLSKQVVKSLDEVFRILLLKLEAREASFILTN